jgi:hypothetical protein
MLDALLAVGAVMTGGCGFIFIIAGVDSGVSNAEHCISASNYCYAIAQGRKCQGSRI